MSTTEAPADKKHGYTFGCEGVVDLDTACNLLGVAAKSTVTNYAEKGFIRIGQHKGSKTAKKVICRKSIDEYLSSLEG